MTLEQKAKAYDEAKARMSKAYNSNRCTIGFMNEIFPELKESEGELIRKGIIHNLKYLANKAQGFVKDELEERIAWLEKQVPVDEEKVLIGARKDVALSIMNFFDKNTLGMGLSNMECEDLEDAVVNSDWLKVYRYMKKKLEKQVEQKQDPCENCDNVMLNCQNFPCIKKRAFEQGKSILEVINEEKVEPKFKVGDWVVSPNGVYWHIDRIENNRYEVTSDTGKCADWPLDTNLYRLWTIQDANKGDVLACDKCILIFDQLSEFNNEQVLMDICHCTSKGFYWQDTKDRDLWVLDGFKPATKEQRDTLFAKMHEAGYEWDAEKKELKIIDWIKHIKYEPNSPSIIEENTEWSKDDEEHLNSLIELLPGLTIRHKWLKSLKDRIQHQLHSPQEWSDEDEETILKMMFTFRTRVFPSSEECISFIDFLKSLKDKVQPRQNWSEEDERIIKRIDSLLYSINESEFEDIHTWLKSIKDRV